MRLLTAVVVCVFAAAAHSDDKEKAKDKALMGAFSRKAGDLDLKMVFKKDSMMEFHVGAGEVGCVMTTEYKIDKDGKYACTVTKFEKKGDFPVTKDKGYKFSFKAELKDKKLIISDLTGDDIGDEQKQSVEGEYSPAND